MIQVKTLCSNVYKLIGRIRTKLDSLLLGPSRIHGALTTPGFLRVSLVLFMGILLLSSLSMYQCTQNKAAEKIARPDLVEIDTLSVFGELERPSVFFPHDLHTRNIEFEDSEKDSCTTCHLIDESKEEEVLSQKFQRLVDTNKDSVMNIYHTECIDCHKETADKGKKAGPVTCNNCHTKEPKFVSSREPMGFDHSLHYRHIEANNEKCELCHMDYDSVAQDTMYEEGVEKTCRYCHNGGEEEGRPPFQFIAHQHCIGCHREWKNQEAGPVYCEGCHSLEKQQQIEQIKNPPRLDVDQPDAVLVSASQKDLASSKMATVPFNHKLHEEYNSTCRVCHHEDLIACRECHTLMGDSDKTNIKLQTAMHEMNSDHSCIGCHDMEKEVVKCAGCHALMEQGQLSDNACSKCHRGATPEELMKGKSKELNLASLYAENKLEDLTFEKDVIQDSVTIDILQDEYEAVTFPHKTIIDTLQKYISNSELATFFHQKEDLVCQGCHHQSPVGEEPPYCENCHGAPFRENKLHMPGLKGAYHRQCQGCHQQLNKDELSECTDCHEEVTEKEKKMTLTKENQNKE